MLFPNKEVLMKKKNKIDLSTLPPEEKEKVLAKRQKKQTIIGLSICIPVSALVGTGIGLVIKMNTVPERTSIDQNKYQDDFSVIKAKYEKAMADNVSDLTTVLEPVEMLQLGYDFLNTTPYLSECYGYNDNGVSYQLITSMKAVYDEKVYYESISHGNMLRMGARYFQSEGNINYYEANDELKNYDTTSVEDWVFAVYEDKIKTMSSNDFINKYGSAMEAPTDLLISSKTIKTTGEDAPTVTKNDDGTYSVFVSFNDTATYNYVTRILATSNGMVRAVLGFSFLRFEAKLDDKLHLLELSSSEEYQAQSVITVTCKSQLNYKYYYENDGFNENWIPKNYESYLLVRKGNKQ